MNKAKSSFSKILSVALSVLSLGVLLNTGNAFALVSDDIYLDENGQVQFYNCPRTIDFGQVRSCVANPIDEFDAVPSTDSFEKYKSGIMDIADLEYDDEYRFAMDYMVRSEYFQLFRNNFLPERTLTREEFIDILFEVLEVEVPSATATDCFADLRLLDRKKSVATQEMRRKKICYAKNKGWLDGRGGFGPSKTINKAMSAKILMSAYDFPGGFTNLNDKYFDDVSAGTWYARFVNAGRKHNIFPDKRRFDPGAALTRREASIWFYNLKRAVKSPMPEDTTITDIKQFTETKLSQLINESRLVYIKPQLKFDSRLYELAVAHSQEMAKSSSLVHGNLNNYKQFLGKNYLAVGENIAVLRTVGGGDISPSVERIHKNMMMEEPGKQNHRANILGESFTFTYYAVGVYEDKSNNRIWVTELFASKTPSRR